MTSPARPAAACWAAGVLFVLGCSDGPKMADVSGVVKVNGQPAEKGSVTFFPLDGKGPTAGTDIGPGGKYAARVPVGSHKVEVRVPKVVGKKALYGKDGPFRDVLEEALPEKYNNQSELKLDVTGTTTKDWDLPPK